MGSLRGLGGLGFRYRGLGFRVRGLGFRVRGLGFRDCQVGSNRYRRSVIEALYTLGSPPVVSLNLMGS